MHAPGVAGVGCKPHPACYQEVKDTRTLNLQTCRRRAGEEGTDARGARSIGKVPGRPHAPPAGPGGGPAGALVQRSCC